MKSKKPKKINQHAGASGSRAARRRSSGGVSARGAVHDGAVELAMAVAGLTALVRVDASCDPFVTEPADLFDRTFAYVGLDDNQMGLLREELRAMLPGIAAQLAAHSQALDRAELRIADYASFLRAALLSLAG